MMMTSAMMTRATCLASNVNTEQLRSQLDQLHSEAQATQRKANNARFRLLRLSEAVENLCQQAARSVQVGKENDARELLLQKKKVMLALEKSKGRVEVLDELAAKLNEAISIKEAQLVENVASDLDFGGDNVDSPVRIVSASQNAAKSLEYDINVAYTDTDVGEDEDLISDITNEADILSYSEAKSIKIPNSIHSGNRATMSGSFRGVLSYVDFLEHLDQQLKKIEEDLVTNPELSTLLLENKEKPHNSRVQQILEILKNIRGIRARIHKFIQTNGET